MRNTHISSLKLERKIPYNPDFHGIINKEYNMSVSLQSADSKQATFLIEVAVKFKFDDSKEEIGSIVAKAVSRVSDVPIPLDADGAFAPNKATKEFRLLVEGALGEDVILPLSLLARSAHLPTLTPVPIVFPVPQVVGGSVRAHRHQPHGGPTSHRPGSKSPRVTAS